MPPKKEARPPAPEVQSAIHWIREGAGTAEIARRAEEGCVVLRRLNRAEYTNTVRDLLHVDVDLSDLLPPGTSPARARPQAMKAVHFGDKVARWLAWITIRIPRFPAPPI